MIQTNWLNIKIGLLKYEKIMERFSQVDVSSDEEFQRVFNGFYRVRRRKPDFYQALYTFLELHKHKTVKFREILSYFYERFGKIEASFSSKILATLNPDMPIWDSEVLKRLHLKPAKYSLSPQERLEATCKIYETIQSWYKTYLTMPEAHNMIAQFNEHIGKTNITPTKKIDFILLQTRE